MTEQHDLVARLQAIDAYINSLWTRAAKLRDQHSGQAHADLNDIRHGIGAIPDGILEAAARIEALESRVRVLEAENAKLLVDLAEAQVALEPFADEANTYDSDDDVLRGGPLISDAMFLRIEEGDGSLTTSIITVGDLRRARAALAGDAG